MYGCLEPHETYLLEGSSTLADDVCFFTLAFQKKMDVFYGEKHIYNLPELLKTQLKAFLSEIETTQH